MVIHELNRLLLQPWDSPTPHSFDLGILEERELGVSSPPRQIIGGGVETDAGVS